MPWLSSSPFASPIHSPRQVSLTKQGAPSSLAYIPPLIDGACGTVLRAEQPTVPLLREDARVMMAVLPTMLRSMWVELVHNARRMSWADMGDMLVHAGLAVLELQMMLAIIPLWLVMPGGAAALWLCACAMTIMGLASVLNGKSRVIRCTAGSDGWMMGQEAEDERWIYVGGMELSARRLSRTTLPSLSKLFSRSFIAIPTRTWGLPLDMLSLLIQRNTPFPSDTTRIVYTQLRTSLLDSSISRVVILSHNLGALPVSKAISQLLSDLPADRLSKLEIYTFGAAAAEFVLPTGEAPQSAPQSPSLTNGGGGHHQPILEQRRPQSLPHVEHFALTSDPFALAGVLRSARETLETRFCGGVFVMSPTSSASAPAPAASAPATTTNGATKSKSKAKPAATAPAAPATGLSISSYLTALFPTQMTASRGAAPGVLDEVMTIDRDVAEKREFAAMSNFVALRSSAAAGGMSSPKPGGGKRDRLSWTALGATAGQKPSAGGTVMDGVAGLEMARKGCKDCDGHRGREVSWLVRYVNVGCVEGTGFKGNGNMNGNGN